MKKLINTLSMRLSRFAERWVPDPMLIAVMLTLMTLLIALLWGNHSTRYAPKAVLEIWGGGIWNLLPFAMQMCLVLITGHALASTPLVRRLINASSKLASSPSRAIMLTAMISMIAGLLNWGLGLIVGAFMAREVGLRCAQRGIKVHYPLLGAAGYTGLLVWHGGLSGTAPLKVTQLKDLAEISQTQQGVPLTDTLFSSTNLILVFGLLIISPLLLKLMSPKDEEVKGADEWIKDQGEVVQSSEEHTEASTLTPARYLEESRGPGLILGALLLIAFFVKSSALGFSHLNLDMINLAALALGLILHPSLSAYGRASQKAAMSTSGIILQFPLYAGIMSVMSGAGITQNMTLFVSQVASIDSLSILTFLMAGLVNLFVPSGGGQWAVQGPLVLESATALNAPIGEAVIAFAHGDAWTNMLQPFWALPLLAITQLKARDIVGYTAALMIALSPWYFFVFYVL